ncbi:MAG: hypothetical protein HC788_14390 [Sphingopyxis sp.]|nr:hypothetical protein [Sphingopyxis sp.]
MKLDCSPSAAVKRMSGWSLGFADCFAAAVLVGGLMIGAAGAVATMLMGDTVATKC